MMFTSTCSSPKFKLDATCNIIAFTKMRQPAQNLPRTCLDLKTVSNTRIKGRELALWRYILVDFHQSLLVDPSSSSLSDRRVNGPGIILGIRARGWCMLIQGARSATGDRSFLNMSVSHWQCEVKSDNLQFAIDLLAVDVRSNDGVPKYYAISTSTTS